MSINELSSRARLLQSFGLVGLSRIEWRAGIVLFLGSLLIAASSNCAARKGQPTGAGVHGSNFVLVTGPGPTDDDVDDTRDQIFLPDIEVFLRNVVSGEESTPVVTDLYGRYLFPTMKPGKYELRWKAQLGWAPGPL